MAYERGTCLCAELTSGTGLDRIVRKASVEQLHRLWRHAGEELRATHSPATLASIVELRRLTLEELEVRAGGFPRSVYSGRGG